MTQASSSVYATPLITDLFSDGRKDIVVPSFVHYLEVLEGSSGAQAVGWPAFHKSLIHSSPLLFDFDFDGIRDILITTYDGEVIFFKDTGEILPEKLIIPRLKVKRDWHKGLNPDPNIREPHAGKGWDEATPTPAPTPAPTSSSSPPPSLSPKVKSPSPNKGRALTPETRSQVERYKTNLEKFRREHGDEAAQQLLSETRARNLAFYNLVVSELKNPPNATTTTTTTSSSPPPPPPPPPLSSSTSPADDAKVPEASSATTGGGAVSRRRLMQSVLDGVEAGPDPTLSEEAISSFEVFEAEKDDQEEAMGQQRMNQEGGGDQDGLDLGDEYEEEKDEEGGGLIKGASSDMAGSSGLVLDQDEDLDVLSRPSSSEDAAYERDWEGLGLDKKEIDHFDILSDVPMVQGDEYYAYDELGDR